MKLNIPERLLLLNILPQKGNLLTLRLIRELRNDLSFTEKEIKDMNLRQDDERVIWDESKDKNKDIKIGNTMKQLIIDTLKKLDENEELLEEHLIICDRFM